MTTGCIYASVMEGRWYVPINKKRTWCSPSRMPPRDGTLPLFRRKRPKPQMTGEKRSGTRLWVTTCRNGHTSVYRRGFSSLERHCSSMSPVWKKNGTIQLCVDLREPKAIITDGYPLPPVGELLQMFHEAVCSSKLDLAPAYHQPLLKESNRDLTTYITREGLFRLWAPHRLHPDYRTTPPATASPRKRECFTAYRCRPVSVLLKTAYRLVPVVSRNKPVAVCKRKNAAVFFAG